MGFLQKAREKIFENKDGIFFGLLGMLFLSLLLPFQNEKFIVYLWFLGAVLGGIINHWFNKPFISRRIKTTYKPVIIISAIALGVYLLRFLPGSPFYSVFQPMSISFPTKIIGAITGSKSILAIFGSILAIAMRIHPIVAGIFLIGGLLAFGIPLITLTVLVAKNFTLILIILGVIGLIIALRMIVKK